MNSKELTSLLARIAGGSEDAFSELYDRTSPVVFGLAMRILGEAATAEEACHDTYLQVHRQAGAFDPERGGPLTWILTIARTRALDRRRRLTHVRSREQSYDLLEDESAGPDVTLAENELAERRRLVRTALEKVSPEEREALGHAFYLGLSHREIADRLKIPLGTIKSRIRSGMTKLRQSLRPLEAWC
ncbi:MAG: sigma-70 family RNA polymerase sigma factor [Planctomycetota bacterium JB042]